MNRIEQRKLNRRVQYINHSDKTIDFIIKLQIILAIVCFSAGLLKDQMALLSFVVIILIYSVFQTSEKTRPKKRASKSETLWEKTQRSEKLLPPPRVSRRR